MKVYVVYGDSDVTVKSIHLTEESALASCARLDEVMVNKFNRAVPASVKLEGERLQSYLRDYGHYIDEMETED